MYVINLLSGGDDDDAHTLTYVRLYPLCHPKQHVNAAAASAGKLAWFCNAAIQHHRTSVFLYKCQVVYYY